MLQYTHKMPLLQIRISEQEHECMGNSSLLFCCLLASMELVTEGNHVEETLTLCQQPGMGSPS